MQLEFTLPEKSLETSLEEVKCNIVRQVCLAKVAKLSSIISGGKRTYKCNCEGTLTTGESTMYC